MNLKNKTKLFIDFPSLWLNNFNLLSAENQHDVRGCFKDWKSHAEQCVVAGGYYINVIFPQ